MHEDEQPSDLNLDLIQMVQKARMLHDETASPSALAAVYWIEAKRRDGDYPAPTAKAGEWRIPLRADDVDAVWERVKSLTTAGKTRIQVKGIDPARRRSSGSRRPADMCADLRCWRSR